MNKRVYFICAVVLAFLLAGCGGGGDGGLSNDDPGTNNLGMVMAFGDSLTQGNECSCLSYPTRLGPMILKTVANTGVSGSRATENVESAQPLIDRFHPAFMLILYGVNDVIHSASLSAIEEALDQIVLICKQNHVVPVLATYPEPILGHEPFAPGTLALNQRIRALASTHGIHCVDLENEFAANPAFYEEDGLHPNDAGTQVMALAFADLF